MLPRASRLRRSQDIVEVVRQGKYIRTPYVHIYVLSRVAQGKTSSHSLRITCVVGKKVNTKATIRHKYQRWLREIARAALPHFSSSYDIVWVGRSSLNHITKFQELKESLRNYI